MGITEIFSKTKSRSSIFFTELNSLDDLILCVVIRMGMPSELLSGNCNIFSTEIFASLK
jgi:hypothetical protein